LKWYEVDLNWYGIWLLEKLGLAKQVYRVKLDELEQHSALGPIMKPIVPVAEGSMAGD
jgi:hypothetical protein